MKKTMWVFFFYKYGKFWSVLPDKKVDLKTLFSEEWMPLFPNLTVMVCYCWRRFKQRSITIWIWFGRIGSIWSKNASRVEDIHAEQQKWIVGLEKQKAEFKRIEKRSSIDSKNSYLCRFGKDSIVQSQNCVRFGKRTILYNRWIV